MECERIRKLLLDYLDNELGPEKRRIAESHIAGCQACSGELRRLKGLASNRGDLEKLSLPQDFAKGIRLRKEAKAGMERLLRRLFYPPYIKLPIEAVTVCAAILVAFYFAAEIGLVKRPKGKEIVLAKKPESTLGVISRRAAKLGIPGEAKAPREKEQVVVFSCLDVDKAVKDISMVVAMLEGSFEYGEPKPLAQENGKMVEYNGAVSADYQADRLAPLTKILSLQIPAERLPVFLTELELMGTIISMPQEISPRVLKNMMSLMDKRDRALLREKNIALRLEIRTAK